VIPTLNEAQAIGATLNAVARMPAPIEVIVVDGGSHDDTPDIARQYRITVITAERGRGTQMHAGACAAQGEVLWFVHADTHPPVDGVRYILEALRNRQVVGGYFRVRFDGSSHAARFLTWLYPRLGWLGLCYGDATLFVRRAIYARIGGFHPFPIFEDDDLVHRLRQYGQFICVPVPVCTSSRRFAEHRLLRTLIRWTTLQLFYGLGVSPRTLGRFYPAMRERGTHRENMS
jgi:rSAM/selenodomain-associated transferase 2